MTPRPPTFSDPTVNPPETEAIRRLFLSDELGTGEADVRVVRWTVRLHAVPTLGSTYLQGLPGLALLEMLTTFPELQGEGPDPLPDPHAFVAGYRTQLSSMLLESAAACHAGPLDLDRARSALASFTGEGGQRWPQWYGWGTGARWCGWFGGVRDPSVSAWGHWVAGPATTLVFTFGESEVSGRAHVYVLMARSEL